MAKRSFSFCWCLVERREIVGEEMKKVATFCSETEIADWSLLKPFQIECRSDLVVCFSLSNGEHKGPKRKRRREREVET